MSDQRITEQAGVVGPNWIYVVVIVVVVGALLFVNRDSFADASTSVFLVAWSVLALLLVWLALSRQRMKTASIILAVAALLIGALGLSMGVPVVLALASVPLAAAFAARAFAPNRVVGGTAG